MRRLCSLALMACWCGLAFHPAPTLAQGVVIRAEDQRVAEVGFRLATAGVARCSRRAASLGLLLQHLGQFAPTDRPVAAQDYHLDHGPGVLAVVSAGPAAAAGVTAGDVLLAIDGAPVPPEAGLDQPLDQTRNRARSDAVDDLLDMAAATGPVTLTMARDTGMATVEVNPVPACPSRVHLARSRQLNAFADGVHVFLTTRLLALTPGDDALAFVIAHEMAHNILGHAALMRAAMGGARASLTRRLEREADLLAADLMLDAGYRIDGVGPLLGLLDQGPFAGLFGNHDSAATRATAIAAHAAARAARP